MQVGAFYKGKDSIKFTVWAPALEQVDLIIVAPEQKILPMTKDSFGYWQASISNAPPEILYFYRLNDEIDRPDPASHYQPLGVHQASQVINHDTFVWTDHDWQFIPVERMMIYELHVGTFTPEGNLSAVIGRLDDLKDLGINTIEMMPVAQFPGKHNWGYDGVYPFAVQNSYGGPFELKKLVDACHTRSLSVILDVVYNHLGPEGNYLRDFGPYFTKKYHSPWGEAINFDDAYSDGVRNYFIENALYWFRQFHIDALRLDAIHAIYDMSAVPFLQELAARVAEYSNTHHKKCYLIAESDLNDTRIIRGNERGGFGIEAQWNDDFHHALHALLTGEKDGYYLDFGKLAHLEKSFKEGFVYSGEYSEYRKRRHGNSSLDIPARQFVVFSQNHDQVGNRMLGERLSALVSFDALKLIAASVLLSPYIPLLFMGEEYGENTPFLYFVDHSDPKLLQAVREGRKAEFKSFNWKGTPPDPTDTETLLKSKLQWEDRNQDKHDILLRFYRTLLHLRREVPAIANLDKNNMEIFKSSEKLLLLHRWFEENELVYIMNFNDKAITINFPLRNKRWRKILDSAENKWQGPGSLLPDKLEKNEPIIITASSFALYEMEALK